ncbi:MAG: DUF3472 domain-containing protein [Sedimentisphaerales bacterium]|nr:DUF3472 domain-containing protein [Sedimentisphaerales bacterium]
MNAKQQSHSPPCLRTAAILVLSTATAAVAELRVPTFTAYLDPNVEGARVSARSGVARWNDPALKMLWFGQIKTPGQLDCSVALRLPKDATTKLRLTVAGQSHEVSATGSGTDLVTAEFGSFDIAEAGYQRFALESLNPPGQPFGDLDALIVDGPATQDAHFNLKPRRNAASVHLFYPIDEEAKVEAFHCEMTGLEDPIWTYYMACGWHRGYFGMQVNSPTERRIIFSVWDSGNEAVNRSRVPDENRVRLVAKGEGVYAGDFGNEGTGGHSHLVYAWKTGQKQRFLVTAKPTDKTHTIYAGYYFHPEKKQWVLISSWTAPKEGGYLRGLYSFSENFGGANGHVLRKALYGNQWIRTVEGRWIELTTASFSHDPTGKADRLDRFMGVENGQFFLSHGGFAPGFTQYGERFSRPAVGQPPVDIDLPE